MRIVLLIASLMLVGVALAQSPVDDADIATARALLDNARQAEAVANAEEANIEGLIVHVNAKDGRDEAVVGIRPTDPGFQAILQAIKNVANARKAEADAALEALGMTRKPTPPAEEAVRGGPPQ